MLTELVSCTKYSLSCAVNSSRCVLRDGTAMCLCHPGFSGDTCDVNIDDCHDVTCQHGGTCVDATLAYHCACAPGYTGNTNKLICHFLSFCCCLLMKTLTLDEYWRHFHKCEPIATKFGTNYIAKDTQEATSRAMGAGRPQTRNDDSFSIV